MWLELHAATLRAEPGRWVLSVAAIALGIALVTAIHTLNHSALTELDQAARVVSGSADLRVEAGRSGFDDGVFPTVVLADGVAAASPVLVIEAERAEASTAPSGPTARRVLNILGIDLFRAAPIQPALLPRAEINTDDNGDRLAALQPDNLFLNDAALRLHAVRVGDTLTFRGPEGPVTLKVAGTLPESNQGAPQAVMDIAAAQARFGPAGRLTRIDVRIQAGTDPAAVQRNLTALLPATLRVTTPAQTSARTDALSRGYRANLTVLALVALFTGGFLVFSVAALSVVRRRSELALLRVLGVTRGELGRALLREGAVAGVAGSVVGIAAGLVLAALLLRIFAGNPGMGVAVGTAGLRIDMPALVVIALLGAAAGMAGAWLPAREAASRPPARGLKSGDEAALMQAVPRARWGLLLILVALPLLALPPVRGVPLAGYAAIALLLFGTLAVLPALLRGLSRHLPPPSRLLPQLAWQQFTAMPGYAVSGLATVVVSFSLVAAMAVMVSSFRESLDQWLGGVLGADVYVRAPGGITGQMRADTVAALAALNGVARSERLRFQNVLLDPAQPAVTLIARSVDATTLAGMTVLARAAGDAPTGIAPAWVSEAMVAMHGARLGQTLTLPVGNAPREVWVAGIWRDYARTWGAVVIAREDYVRWTGDDALNDLALDFAPGADLTAAIANIRKLPGGDQLDIARADEIRKLSLSIFDRTFAITYALELAALIVGMAGIAAHFAALAVTRRKEFGVLRHLGFTRRELGRLLALEGAVTGAAGAVTGLALGFAISLILIHVVNRQSFHWGMSLHVPTIALAVLALALVLLAALSARWAGRAAMRTSAVLAVKAET